MNRAYLAIDIGASSGRHIVGWREDGKLHTKEVYRFENRIDRVDGNLIWDVTHLLDEVKSGIVCARDAYPGIVSLAIDTWGVDYVLLNGDTPVLPCYAYRDDRTKAAVERVHALVPFNELYARTGIQFQPFNTVYQLYADKLAGRLDSVTDFLMLPEYLMYRLTGVKKKEYTNATTTGLVHAETGKFDLNIVRRLSLPERLFPKLSYPGETVGEYQGIKAVFCATHDTASAVEGIPLEKDALFLSSGTWSLLGGKFEKPLTDAASRRSNFTNEGGVGYIRYLKNIMGLWIVQSLHKQLGIDFAEMTRLARTSGFVELFDVNDARFTAPADMRAVILRTLKNPPVSDADLLNCVYHSLAYSYGNAVRDLEANTGKTWDRLTIAGGGAKNEYLNELTARYTGKRVTALPIEATALGNLKIQMEADK